MKERHMDFTYYNRLLKPCPCCKSTDVALAFHNEKHKHGFVGECNGCGFSSNGAAWNRNGDSTPEEAVEKWNRRVERPEGGAVRVCPCCGKPEILKERRSEGEACFGVRCSDDTCCAATIVTPYASGETARENRQYVLDLWNGKMAGRPPLEPEAGQWK